MKTVIITGGNAGLGYETAKVFAQDGNWHIVIASRSEKRLSEAVQQLIQETGHQQISGMVLDLASLDSVRQFVNQFSETSLPPLHGIICNAGLNPMNWNKSADGIQMTFAVNHLGHFLLVNLLLKYLQKPARIVMVSSGTHLPEKLMARVLGVPAPKYRNAEYLAYPERAPADAKLINPRQAYSTSKLCNVLFAYELSRRLQLAGKSTSDAPINVFAIDPGLMPGTGLVRDLPDFVQSAFASLVRVIEPLTYDIRLPEESAQDMFRLITDPQLANETGLYFDGHKQAKSSADSYNTDFQRDLWETSVQLSALQPEESILSIEALALT